MTLGSKLTTNVDVYSFGVMLWEMVKKQPAFSHHSDYERFSRAVTVYHERPPLTGIAEPLANLMTTCWTANPNDRPDFPQICDHLDDAMIHIACPENTGRTFWRNNFPGQLHVPWREFGRAFFKAVNIATMSGLLQKLEHELPARPTDKDLLRASISQKREFALRSVDNFRVVVTAFHNSDLSAIRKSDVIFLVCLKHLFVSGGSGGGIADEVTLEHFGAMMGWLAPLDSSITSRLSNMFESRWFHGFLSKNDAESRLRGGEVGSYLVRFSNSNPDNYVISKVVAGNLAGNSAGNSIKHTLIPYNPSQGFSFQGKNYPTFQNLLDDCSDSCQLFRPNSCSIFRTMLTPESAYSANDD